MKKMLFTLLCFGLILGLSSITVHALSVGDLTAGIDANKQVTVSGTVPDGAGKPVTIMVLDPNGAVDYVNSCISGEDGRFEFTYILTNSTKGRYSVTISSADLAHPSSTWFDYGEGTGSPALTAAAEINADTKRVTVSGSINAGVGRLITVKVTSPDNKTEYAGLTVSEGKGTFRLSFLLTSSTKGMYSVSVGALGIISPVKCSFGYGAQPNVKAVISRGKVVTVSGFGGAPGTVAAVLITDPNGKYEYANSTSVKPDGTYAFSYTMANTAKGKYAVAVGMKALQTPLTTYFIYGGEFLESLTVSGAGLEPSFSPENISYSAAVAESASSAVVTATAMDSAASVRINGNTAASGAASAAISLQTGSNPVNIVVTAPDGAVMTYTVDVTRNSPVIIDAPEPLSNNSSLHGLTLSSGTLSPAFAAGTTAYTASVAYETSSITVTPTADDSNATVKVNDTAVNSGHASGAISLSVGANSITVKVTAQDSTTKTYTITVTRQAALLSNNSSLSGLTVSSGTLSPTFGAATTAYTVSVAYATESITVTPTADDNSATVKVNDTAVNSGSASGAISLSVGANSITVKVTAQDSTTKTYTITVTRQAAPLSNNSSLSGLTVSSGTLSPAFAAATTAYTVSVAYATESITVTPTVDDSNATVKVNDTAVNSGHASGAISLSVGANSITVKVTAQDSTTKTYTVTVTRETPDVSLSNLSVMWALDGNTHPGPSLISFNSQTYQYEVTHEPTSNFLMIYVSAAATDPNATVKIFIGNEEISNPMTRSLPQSDFTITVKVTGQDGVTTQTYSILVHISTGN